MPDPTLALYFRLLNEIGIIAQLSRTLLEARLPSGFVLAQFSVLNHLVRVSDGQTPLTLARAKIENCARAKQAKVTYESGVRIGRTIASGGQEIMDDATRAQEIRRIQGIIAADCK